MRVRIRRSGTTNVHGKYRNVYARIHRVGTSSLPPHYVAKIPHSKIRFMQINVVIVESFVKLKTRNTSRDCRCRHRRRLRARNTEN